MSWKYHYSLHVLPRNACFFPGWYSTFDGFFLPTHLIRRSPVYGRDAELPGAPIALSWGRSCGSFRFFPWDFGWFFSYFLHRVWAFYIMFWEVLRHHQLVLVASLRFLGLIFEVLRSHQRVLGFFRPIVWEFCWQNPWTNPFVSIFQAWLMV